jgi:hypothetical protein
MRGIAAREKRYVEVISKTDEDGNVTPLKVVWSDGHIYDVDRVMDRRRACSLKTGGTGIRYTISVGGKSTYLFYEGPRWFVEAKVVSMPS